jgi:paraquat-inducible protein A
MIRPASLADTRRHFWLGPALALSLAALVAAWFLPLMTVEKLLFWTSTVTLARAIGDLLREREIFIFVVLVLFSMVFPVVKIVAGLWVWARQPAGGPGAERAVRFIQALGKWSMVDVFVVALTVVAIKISIVSDVAVHAGVYVFCAAVIATMGLMHLLERALRRRPDAAA